MIKSRVIANPSSRKRAPGAQGFTLVELLVVLSIIAILSVLSFPALSSLTSGNVDGAVSGISLTLDQAKAYAMAHNTYVWVGFSQNTTNQQLAMGVVAGTTGQVTDINSSKTYSPIIKVQTYNNFAIESNMKVSGMNTLYVSDIGNFPTSFQQMAHGTSVNFTSGIQYNPQGEASTPVAAAPPTHASQWVQIGLQPVYGGNTSSPNVAVFQVATLTGQVQIFRQ